MWNVTQMHGARVGANSRECTKGRAHFPRYVLQESFVRLRGTPNATLRLSDVLLNRIADKTMPYWWLPLYLELG